MKFLLSCLFIFLISEAWAVPSLTSDANEDGLPDQWYELTDGRLTTLKVDRDYDGRLIRQEIDTNFDEKVDVWAYLFDGIYIEKLEQDSDFDGRIDLVQEYGP
ncbi:hypothetical protein ES705_19731 [subsurface metagenome]